LFSCAVYFYLQISFCWTQQGNNKLKCQVLKEPLSFEITWCKVEKIFFWEKCLYSKLVHDLQSQWDLVWITEQRWLVLWVTHTAFQNAWDGLLSRRFVGENVWQAQRKTALEAIHSSAYQFSQYITEIMGENYHQ